MIRKLLLVAFVCFATMAEAQNQKGTFSIKPMVGANVNINDYEQPVVTTAVVTQNDICKSVDFGIPLGLSYEYKNISLDARYYFGLTKIDKTENPDTAKNRYFSITLGYRFHL